MIFAAPLLEGQIFVNKSLAVFYPSQLICLGYSNVICTLEGSLLICWKRRGLALLDRSICLISLHSSRTVLCWSYFIGGWQWQRCWYDNRCWWTDAKQSGEWSTPCKYNFSHSLDVCSSLDQVWSILPAFELIPVDLSLLAAWPVKGERLQCRQKWIIVDLVPSYTQDTGLFF